MSADLNRTPQQIGRHLIENRKFRQPTGRQDRPVPYAHIAQIGRSFRDIAGDAFKQRPGKIRTGGVQPHVEKHAACLRVNPRAAAPRKIGQADHTACTGRTGGNFLVHRFKGRSPIYAVKCLEKPAVSRPAAHIGSLAHPFSRDAMGVESHFHVAVENRFFRCRRNIGGATGIHAQSTRPGKALSQDTALLIPAGRNDRDSRWEPCFFRKRSRQFASLAARRQEGAQFFDIHAKKGTQLWAPRKRPNIHQTAAAGQGSVRDKIPRQQKQQIIVNTDQFIGLFINCRFMLVQPAHFGRRRHRREPHTAPRVYFLPHLFVDSLTQRSTAFIIPH